MIDHNDPRLIDYALGELTPEEAKAFEAELNQPENAEALKAMKEFQTVAGAATQALATEPAGQLRAEQREAVIEQASTPPPIPIAVTPRFRYFRRIVALAAAACIVGGFSVVVYYIHDTMQTFYGRPLTITESLSKIPSIFTLSSSISSEAVSVPESQQVGELAKIQAAPPLSSRPSSTGNVSVYTDPASAATSASGGNEVGDGIAGRKAKEEAAPTEHRMHLIEGMSSLRAEAEPTNRYMADASKPAATPAPSGKQDLDAEIAETEADESLDDWLSTPTTTMSQQRIGGEEGHSLGYVPSPMDRNRGDANKPMPQPEPAPAPPTDKPMEAATASNVAVTTAPEVQRQSVTSDGAREMKPIDVEYPEPFFGGTPLDYWGPNLEPQDYRSPRSMAGDQYLPIVENVFLDVMRNPLSTFSVDVDSGSYSNVRRHIMKEGYLPTPDAVRIEEMINYFKYDLAQPTGEAPFSVTMEMAECPWAQGHKLARVALQGRNVVSEERNPANLVFLIDVSGSMSNSNKLPLAKEAMKALLNELEPRDRVAIVTYASGVSVPLNSTPCTEKDVIRRAIDSLGAGGSTHGSAGIQQAYQIARANFISGGINRVLLATDGDFNVGTTSHDALMNLISTEAKSKVFLTVMGFGYGNLKDGTLEQIADKGNGNYAYIDDYAEARRVLVDQINGTLVTIAKDVKIQVEFNPQHIQSYRLIGYENRALEDRDFNDDTKDAGEIGAGHQVTALYQLVPNGASVDPGVDQLRYQPKPQPEEVTDRPVNPEWMTVKLRYKEPEGDKSSLIELPCRNTGGLISEATEDMKFVASIAAFGMMLRHSQYQGTASYDRVIALAESGKKNDTERQGCIDMMVTAKTLAVSGQRHGPVYRLR